METKHFIVEEAEKKEIDELFGVDSFEMCFQVMTKEGMQLAGCVSLKMLERSVVELRVHMKDNYLSLEEEVLENYLNHAFYRLNARKIQMNCPVYDHHKRRLLTDFGFVVEHEDAFSLYKEEYLRWLRARGKTLGFLQAAQLRRMFVMVALIGVALLWVDLSQNRSDLRTVFYTYMTGIGVTGSFACSWMIAKRKIKEKNHVG